MVKHVKTLQVLRSVTVPVLAGAVIFVACIAVSIGIVMSKPHTIGEEDFETISFEDPVEEEEQRLEQERKQTVFVHVTGQVQNPGVYELEAGSRINDAIELAGGSIEGALTDAVNLARVLHDGEQIFVPDETTLALVEEHVTFHGASSININNASQDLLETLPGVGPAIAGRIVAWRDSNGGFAIVEDLMQVQGIGPKVYESLKDLVTL